MTTPPQQPPSRPHDPVPDAPDGPPPDHAALAAALRAQSRDLMERRRVLHEHARTPADAAHPPDADDRRCWTCRALRPRAALRWGNVDPAAPALWHARAARVLRCPDCSP